MNGKRVLTLLSSTMKIVENNNNQKYKHIEKTTGLEKKWSTIDVIFIVKQVVNKAIEYKKPAYTCVIDHTKAFDIVQLSDIVNNLKNKHMSKTTILSIVVYIYWCYAL